MEYPNKILHWINGQEVSSLDDTFFEKYNPANGKVIAAVTAGKTEDVEKAVDLAKKSFEIWSAVPVMQRADILRRAALLIEERKDEAAEIIALESGKSKKSALGEVGAAIECGLFIAGESRRFFGQILPSVVPDRIIQLIRQSIGVGALIVPFNNPLASIAWKTFPALLCGNAAILKSHEDTPYIAVWFARILKIAGLPAGVFSVIQGVGEEAGNPLVKSENIKFISFTGSVNTARKIIQASANRLAKVSVETGGKNPFVVCDDADLEEAVSLAIASVFVDGGQRCAAASRLIIFDSIYEKFKAMFLAKVETLRVGVKDEDDFGAIINQKRLNQIMQDVSMALGRGGTLLYGGRRLGDENHKNGYFLSPTVLENISPDDEISQKEIFGPVVILYRIKDLNEAIDLANHSQLKLSGAIHTKNINRAQEFMKRYQAGVVRVNGPTHGSEPHVPFGGVGLSGNGWREPGEKALDFYADWKQISIDYNQK